MYLHKIKVIVYLFIFNFFFLNLSLSSENNYFVSLKYKKVHVRYGPSLDSPIKYIYKKKYLPVKVIDKKEHFRRIIDHKKNSGWIHKTQLIKSNSLITTSQKILFKKPTKFSKPIVKISKGRLLLLKKCNEEWCKVKTENYLGWIKTDNIWGNAN